MRLALGPCLFDWGKNALKAFYRQMAFETSVDLLYVGEVVCSKRQRLTPAEMVELARELRPSGKEVVFSTLGLVMNEGEEENVRELVALAAAEGIALEANDLAAIALAEGHPLVAGPHIATYNSETVAFLKKVGVRRVVLPVELSGEAMEGIMRGHPDVEMEVFAFGKLPLTFSARCYTARAFQFSKGNCQFKCGDFPDGMTMRTQEGIPFLTINGTEIMSNRRYNLIHETHRLAAMGAGVLRLSPQSGDMPLVVNIWRERVEGRISASEAWARLLEVDGGEGYCNGYFFSKPGLDFVDGTSLS